MGATSEGVMSYGGIEMYRDSHFEIECLAFVTNDAELLREYDAAWNRDQENDGSEVIGLWERLVADGRFVGVPDWWLACDTETCATWHDLVMKCAPPVEIEAAWRQLSTVIEADWREGMILTFTVGEPGPVPGWVFEVTGLGTQAEVSARYAVGTKFEKGKPLPKPID